MPGHCCHFNRLSRSVRAIRNRRLFSIALWFGLLDLAMGAAADLRPLLFLGDKDYPPVAYLDGEIARGMDVDLTKALAAPMKREIRVELMDWKLAQEKVLAGEADGLLGLTITDERKEQYDFARPTFTREFGLIVRAGERSIHGAKDLSGRKVGVTAGGFPRKHLEKDSGASLVIVENYRAGLDRLAAREIDALAADLWVAAHIMERDRISGVVIVGKPFATLPCALAVKKGNTALLQEIDQAVQTLQANGTVARILEDWRPQEMVFASRRQLRELVTIAVGVLLVLALAVLALWIITLKRQARIQRQGESERQRLTRDLRERVKELTLLHGAARLLEGGRPLNQELLGELVAMIPAGWMHPEVCVARIACAGVEVQSPGWRETPWKQSARFAIDQTLNGVIEAAYLEAKPMEAEGPFLAEERALIESLADMLSAHAKREQFESALRESESRYRAVVEFSPECVVVSVDERIVFINPAGARMIGEQPPQALIGRSVYDFVPEETRDLIRTRRREVAERGAAVAILESPMRRADGTIVIGESQAVPLVYGGRPAILNLVRDVSQRRAAEQALRESEEKFSKAFRSSPAAMAISSIPDGRIVDINPAYERTFGVRRDAVLGRTTLELNLWTEPQQRERMMQQLHSSGEVRDEELPFRRPDGRMIYTQYSGVAVEIGGERVLLSVLVDLTARKQMEQALRDSEARVKEIFDHTTDSVFLIRVEPDGGFVYESFNPAAERLSGFSSAMVQGRRPEQCMPAGVAAALNARYRACRDAGTNQHYEHTLDFPAGTRTFDTFLVPIKDGNGRVHRLAGFARDVTEQRRTEAEHAEALRREKQSREQFTRQLITSQEAERRRIAGELHDSLGQNLLLVKNRAQLALAQLGNEKPELREQLEGIQEVATQSIAEVRQISRDLHPYQLDHLGLTRALDSLISSVAQSTSIQFESKLDPVDEVFAREAATNLYRIVQEALNNVLKHSRAQAVRIELERDVHQVRLLVRDNGCGFEPGRADARGMGLRNIDERAQMLAGEVRISTRPGAGTTIEVLLPIAEET